MSWIKNFYSFLKSVFSGKRKCLPNTETETPLIEENSEEELLERFNEEFAISEDEDRINANKRTLLTKLYVLEQEITVFENTFPDEYQAYMERIKMLRENYNSSLEEIKKTLTFEINPESDSYKAGEVTRLAMDIRRFIEKEVRFDIISKRFKKLITKLNVLYNVSIFHFKEQEKEKVVSQLNPALKSELRIVGEFKECEYILSDLQLKEKIINLISYLDYEIYKLSIRNSSKTIEEIIRNLVMITEFEEFDYKSAFKAFMQDELSDFGELLSLISDNECREILRKKLNNLLTELMYSSNSERNVTDITFWNEFLNIESNLLEMIKFSGADKEKIKVKIIDRMNINMDESEVIVLPKTNAYMSLINIYSKTHNENILILIKLLKTLSDDVTYKEIYFLLLLFDAIEEVQNTKNELIRHIEKYLNKYPYNRNTIIEKKKRVINSSNKEYVVAFSLNEYDKEIIENLNKLNFDFYVDSNNNILLNSFYFNGLENITNSLQTNTKKITT